MKTIPRLSILLSILLILAATGLAQTPPPPPPPPAPVDRIPAPPVKEWREFKYEPGNLALIMPGKPAEMSQLLDTQIGKVPLKLFTAEMGLATYLAMYAEYPVVFDTPGSIKHALDTGRDLMLGKMGAKLISEKEVAYGKYPGREWNGASAQFVMHSRTYIVNQRLYLFLAAMPADEYKRLSETQSNDVVKFLNSFKLIKKPDPPPASAGSLARLEASAEKMVLPDDFLDRPIAWREFSSKEYGFNIQFPSEPFQQAIPLVPDNRRLDIQLWMAKGDHVVCQMLVQPMLTPPRDEIQKNILFKGLVAGLADDGDMKLLSEEPISFRGHPGRAYKFRMDTEAVSGKAYIIGARVYLMLAIFVGPNDNEKEASRFFDSFTPLDAPTSPSAPTSPPPPLAPPNPTPSKQETRVGTVKVSGGPVIMEKAIKKVEPDYPPIARAAGVEGKVIVSIKTSAEGKVIEATIIEGHPLLRDSVLRAAKQWEFKPSELSGVPVKVQAELTFHFTLK